ncbi:MAG: hypothetical protein ACI4XN_07330 [Candidatus Kurthia intestinigallinarum]
MKHFLIPLLIILLFVSCSAPESNVPPVEVPPAVEVPPVEEEEKDPYETSPLSSVSVTPDTTTQTLQGTWLMYSGGNVSDNLILCFDSSDEKHKVVYADKTGGFIGNQISISSTQIVQIWLSGMADYIVPSYSWDSKGFLNIAYVDKNTGKTYRHSLVKYSDSFIDETAFEDTSLLYGLWVNADKTKGLRFLSDGTLWIYKGNSSEKCKWKDSDGNALAVMDSFGFSEKVPFTKIGDNLFVYKGEKYFKAE